MTLDAAAERLGRNTATVRRRVEAGKLAAQRVGRRAWIHEDSLDALVTAESEWISAADAAELVGCSTFVILAAAERGEVRRRETANRAVPSLDRASVLAFKTT